MDILAEIIPVPAALVMRIRDEDIEVFLSSRSSGNPYHPGDRETLLGSGLYCEAVIRTRTRLLVPNAPSDEDWKDNPDIALDMVSYLGFPLMLPDGKPFGTICVLDRVENAYTPQVEELMQNFRALLESQLAALVTNQQMETRMQQLEDSLGEIRTLQGILPLCMYCKSIRRDDGSWVPVEQYLLQQSGQVVSHGICPGCFESVKKPT